MLARTSWLVRYPDGTKDMLRLAWRGFLQYCQRYCPLCPVTSSHLLLNSRDSAWTCASSQVHLGTCQPPPCNTTLWRVCFSMQCSLTAPKPHLPQALTNHSSNLQVEALKPNNCPYRYGSKPGAPMGRTNPIDHHSPCSWTLQTYPLQEHLGTGTMFGKKHRLIE